MATEPKTTHIPGPVPFRNTIPSGPSPADIRLAEAATTMLDALKAWQFVDELLCITYPELVNPGVDSPLSIARTTTRAAIAKATGQERDDNG